MKTLTEARDWYVATRRSLMLMRRLGERHWASPSLADATIWQDDHFKMLETADIVAQTTTGLKPVDDLAVVVLFSVFESLVRDFLTELIKPHADKITDPILKAAAEDAMLGVAEGSFYRRVLEPLKVQSRVSADLVTEVDQVQDSRNWVAHGRREEPTNNVTPEMAFQRLSNFLNALGISVEPGPFDWNKFTPIIVETDGTSLWLMDGMTRVENARRAGIASLPATVYRR